MTVWSRVKVSGPLGRYALPFAEELVGDGYADLSIAELLRVMGHLSRWVASEGPGSGVFSQAEVDEYCRARAEQGYTARLTPGSLGPLLVFLRAQGLLLVPPPAVRVDADSVLLDRYERYLVEERGLVDRVVSVWVLVAARFLGEHEGLAAGRLMIGPGEVSAFCVRDLTGGGSVSRNRAAALRSFARFLHVEGVVAAPLAQAVPRVAVRQGTGLPRGLARAEVERLVASCDRGTRIGKRDYAILVVLARLWLRAGEVAGLSLDEIDWRAGELVVRGKGGRRDRLPLPCDVGEALVDHLRGRAQVASRAVFLRAFAPIVPLSGPGITWVVYAACDRAGVGRVGAHRLRHSLASDVLRTGGSLVEVAQVLRHAAVATSAVYAKVDVGALAPLALPWPGGAA